MPSYTTLLDEALEAWRYTRRGVIEEIENIPEEQLVFKPTPDTRSIADVAEHIVESGLLMSGELTRPDGNFRRKPYPALLKEHAGHLGRLTSKRALIDALDSTHAEGARRIREAGELLMLQVITQFNGEPGTRFSWMHHGISHEEYHRGQLALYARLVGQVPALTRRILGLATG